MNPSGILVPPDITIGIGSTILAVSFLLNADITFFNVFLITYLYVNFNVLSSGVNSISSAFKFRSVSFKWFIKESFTPHVSADLLSIKSPDLSILKLNNNIDLYTNATLTNPAPKEKPNPVISLAVSISLNITAYASFKGTGFNPNDVNKPSILIE